jgi:acetyl esterase/lipase
MTDSNKDDDRRIFLKPHSFFFHPHKSWFDIFLSLVLYLVFPLRNLARLPPKNDNEQLTSKNLKFYRNMIQKGAVGETKSICASWEKSAGCVIVECRYQVRRRAILKQWGFCPDDPHGERRPKGDISVVLRFPASLHAHLKNATDARRNEFGCVAIDRLDLKELDCSKAPIVLSFHGGGLTLGVADMGDCLGLTQKVCEETGMAVIYASVEYSLAPEFPFPIAIEEGLTVAAHFLEVFSPTASLHLQGASAGSNIASVLTMELFRRYPGRIASSLLICPMMDPAADSESYFLQSRSTCISSDWLRWCWRCYLELGESNPNEDDKNPLRNGSNYSLWADWQSKNAGTVLARLVNATTHLPEGLDGSNAPKIIIQTNQGDPLQDDGLQLVAALTSEGAHVEHLDHKGSHWFGTKYDKHLYASLVASWKQILFSEGD